jgi:two-component system NtrC family sensor kinase
VKIFSSLTARVVAVLVIATTAPTAIVGALAIDRIQSDLEREVVRGNLALIRALGETLDERLQGSRRALRLAASHWADERSIDTPGGDATADRLLRRLARETPFASLSIISVDGELLQGEPVDTEPTAGAHAFGSYIGDLTFDDGRPRVEIVAQARSRTGELVGVFVGLLDVQFVADTLADARLGAGARLMVVDNHGVLVATSDEQAGAAGRPLRGVNPAVDRALASATEGSLHAGGVVSVYRNLTGFQGARGIPWSIVGEQPERDAYALARAATRDTLIAGIAALALALLLGVFLATRLTRPLRDLADRADAIAGDEPEDESTAAPVTAVGEIGLLARRIEEMAERIGERDQLQEALARGDRLASVGTMAASVAHEINNPLTTVLGYAKLLLEDKGENHPDRDALTLVADEAERMKQIVATLLDYSRAEPETASTEPADVNALIRRTAALLVPSLKRSGVAVKLELAGDLPNAALEARKLQQVLVNLVQNAIQAMPDGGAVTLGSARDGDWLELTVDDEGPGISAEERERVFETFYTTKAAGAGTGLGLALCRHLLARVGGTVDVVDPPADRGARFRVRVPVA